jgi:hypothetical protein
MSSGTKEPKSYWRLAMRSEKVVRVLNNSRMSKLRGSRSCRAPRDSPAESKVNQLQKRKSVASFPSKERTP